MKINSLLMDEKDNVVTCTEEIPAGTFAAWLREDGTAACVKATEDILYCHKIAVRPVKKGSDVIKYGQSIGRATADIPEGAWVSHENIFAGPRDYGSELIPLAGDGSPLPDAAKSFSWGGDPGDPEKTASALEGLGLTRDPETGEVKFLGYRRAEGRSGIRNHVLILPTCSCASESCRIAASQVNGAVNIIFNTGCSDVEENTAMSQKILTGFALNPNVFGVVIIGLGCETVGHRELCEKIKRETSKPVLSFGIQDEGGTLRTIEKAVRAARDMAVEASLQRKELCPMSDILLGIECGGSDATSGIASNPAVGECSDLLVDLGASSILSESIEWIGAEHIVAGRGATPLLHNQIIEVCRDYEAHIAAAGQDCRAGQPTPGNKKGGLSTLDEKSLGCIRKGGTRPVNQVLRQAERPSKTGALVMDTAGYDISSVTSMVAGGCNLVVFTTGRGTPTGNAIAPVVKVTANEKTFRMMDDNMDVDLSAIVRGEKTYRQMGALLVRELMDVMNGKLTKAEAYGFSDIAIDHICRFV